MQNQLKSMTISMDPAVESQYNYLVEESLGIVTPQRIIFLVEIIFISEWNYPQWSILWEKITD